VSDALGKESAEILFLRVPPRGLLRPFSGIRGSGPNRFGAVAAADGIRGRVGERNVTSFWIGMGRGVRMPGRKLLQRLREGAIAEIVDIGCAGALDSGLRRGDLVLSSADIALNCPDPISVRRRPELRPILKEVAAGRGVSLHIAPILTHERFISSRTERIELFERTGCAAVQMEHAWFLQLLQTLLPVDRYEKIRITHLVFITDAVPRSTGWMEAARSCTDALVGYLLPGGRDGIASLRREVLFRWPAE
jgi:hypothetical protein